ncbi:MAG: hypothetical protein Q7T82_18180 [Armatimonadota bacterium]|nr:hypothetical protein [Armatimonadota bacterium]
MSWLSKWWKDDGRKVALDALRKTLGKRAKEKALQKLHLLLGMLDRMDIEGVRRELLAMVKYVEEL